MMYSHFVLWITVSVVAAVVLTLVLFSLLPQKKKLAYQVEMPAGVQDPLFKRALGDLMGPPFKGGNKITVLKNGDEIFPAMLKAIASAKKTVTFESYIYWSGDVGAKFADALSERARNNVQVHLLLDWAGSQKIEEKYIEKMKKAGVEVFRYHPLRWYNINRMNNRTHRKLLVIDGEIGFTGGVGIADEWNGNGLQPKHWRDMHFQIEGPVVAQIQAAFLDNWMKVQTKIKASNEYFPEPDPVAPFEKNVAQMFKSTSQEGSSSVKIMYLLAVAGARKSILLESAYFIPDKITIREIIKAHERGVTVEIIVPGEKTDAEVVRYASRQGWGELLKAGIKIYEYQPAMFHCKVLIVDNYFVSVGSTNFDERSFNLNDEANLNVLDDEFAAEMSMIFEVDKSR